MLVNVHLCLDLPHELHHEVLLYSNFSYRCHFKCLVWHRCADNISTNGSPDYFHHFSSNEIRAYEIEQEYLSAVQDPESLSTVSVGVNYEPSPRHVKDIASSPHSFQYRFRSIRRVRAAIRATFSSIREASSSETWKKYHHLTSTERYIQI